MCVSECKCVWGGGADIGGVVSSESGDERMGISRFFSGGGGGGVGQNSRI